MATFIALLRGVNVGGRNMLPMSKLKSLCENAGFTNVRTYINSGNVVFDSGKDEVAIRRALQAELTAFAGKAIGVVVRSPQQMAAVLERNPFAELPPNKTVAIFLDAAPKRAALLDVSGRRDEELRLGKREIYVYYPSGQGRSKLKISAASDGTARNMNTVASLAQLAGAG